MTYISFLPEHSHKPSFRMLLVLMDKYSWSMSAFFVLVIASILVAAGFLVAFIWSVRTDQYEDRKGAAMRMLYDDKIDSNQ